MANIFDDSFLTEAHKVCKHHRGQVENSKQCGCFHCVAVFAPSLIKRWVFKTKKSGRAADATPDTALCPMCDIDAVIGDASDLPIDDLDFLAAMKKKWFGTPGRFNAS